jgi:hypothetical protein
MSGVRPDKTDRFDPEMNMSVLSVPSGRPFGKNLGNMPGIRTDRTDRFDPEMNMSVFSVPSYDLPKRRSFNSFDGDSLLDDFEERLAIAEYDGQQTPTQAQRIAYQDAFIAVLNTLPYKDTEDSYEEDWLDQRIKAARDWLSAQGLQ